MLESFLSDFFNFPLCLYFRSNAGIFLFPDIIFLYILKFGLEKCSLNHSMLKYFDIIN
jgi:hypothetical protein